jgi:hypothetical protein
MSRSSETFKTEITVTGAFVGTPLVRRIDGGRISCSGGHLLAVYFFLLKISFPCRRGHLEVATLVKALIDRRWSAGMVFETRDWKCEFILQ